MFEYIITFIISMIVGYAWAINQHISSVPHKQLKDEDTIDGLRKELEYYKKLTKTLADENMEFRRKQ